MKNKNKKEFRDKALKKILDGEWGLKEINYLHEHKLEYGIDKEDIKDFLVYAYEYAYILAMEDGVLSPAEMIILQDIRSYSSKLNHETNRYEIESIKTKVMNLIKKTDRKEFKIENNEIKINEIKECKNKNNHPYWIHRPKLTPYD